MQQPQRASRLRLVALASTVALAVALPLAAATAGQDAPAPASPPATDGKGGPETGPEPEREPGQRQEQRGASGPESGEGSGTLSRRLADEGRPNSVCGPEITSPEGVEAQTCVLTQGDATWARAYYRNATNGELATVLTLMRPDGRATRVRCAMPAAGEPGLCETPRVPVTEGEEATAVAEVASRDGERLLLRAGSAPGGPGGDNSRPLSRT
ncbi:hypothetical protein [Streptomyces sp. NPDC048172]|uniref:hypothetical protein n=1 Tax=Streptomyces sp. NPDC048172 TaxID=3365505 RepID=UPI003723F072